MTSPDIAPTLTILYHEINTEAHPTCPPGWRWAVMVGDTPPASVEFCAHAGWTPTEREALAEGYQAGVTACRAAHLLGVPARIRVLRLDYDPIPPGGDRLNVV